MVVVVGEVIGDARKLCVNFSTAHSCAFTSSPVAALTSGGPPRKIVPVSLTMIVSSDMAGTYAPPAVHDPITAAICGMRSADSRA